MSRRYQSHRPYLPSRGTVEQQDIDAERQELFGDSSYPTSMSFRNTIDNLVGGRSYRHQHERSNYRDAVHRYATSGHVDQAAAARDTRALQYLREREAIRNRRARLASTTAAPGTPTAPRRIGWNLRDVGPRYQPRPLRTVSEREYPSSLYAAAAGRRLRTTGKAEATGNAKTGGANVWKTPLKKSGEDWEREIAEDEARRIRGHGLDQEERVRAAAEEEEEARMIRGHGLEQPMVKRRQTWGFKGVEHKM
ncbi:hypothetical protein CKM354_000674400 [Cercospora kikuchii]|uniref:Uncharacterized protein n=1 Tax=Cercospora kikuchii TaxID=84275 RepID=A0A9P3CN58_9PEZI|nr:uncharacterized protein CKM354_000674400 [Cercospora kikuchii]GIZ43520.1 hypothetical protein CKM354_000674400 [Cercospora kikuchii]